MSRTCPGSSRRNAARTTRLEERIRRPVRVSGSRASGFSAEAVPARRSQGDLQSVARPASVREARRWSILQSDAQRIAHRRLVRPRSEYPKLATRDDRAACHAEQVFQSSEFGMKHRVLHFGPFELDHVAHELRRDGAIVELPTSAFDCLAYLVEHRDRAISRDEIILAVWGRPNVSETLLGQTIARLRRELGDTGSDQHSIRTISRKGYRWVAPTSESPETVAQRATASSAEAPEANLENARAHTPHASVRLCAGSRCGRCRSRLYGLVESKPRDGG